MNREELDAFNREYNADAQGYDDIARGFEKARLERAKAMMGGLPDEAVTACCYFLCCWMWVFLIIMTVLLIVLENARKKSDGCGIPVFEWLEVYFGLIFGLPVILSFSLCCAKSSIKCFVCWLLWGLWIWLVAFFTLVCVGWSLYFSEGNNCSAHTDTNVAAVFMIIFCVIGLLYSICACIGIICIPCAWCVIAK